MQGKKCFLSVILSALLCTMGVAFGQSQPTTRAPHVYSSDGNKDLVLAGTYPPGQMPDEKALEAESKAINTRVLLLQQEAAESSFLGQYAQAEAEARESLSPGQNYGMGADILAEALADQGKDQEALQEYQSIFDDGDRSRRILLPYDLLLLKAGRWPQAVSVYNMVLPKLTAQDIASIRSGSIGDDDSLRAASNFTPDVVQPAEMATALHIDLSISLMFDGDGPWLAHSKDIASLAQNAEAYRALDQCVQALQLSPDSELANYEYGQALKLLGRTTLAQAAFRKTIRIGHGSVKLAAINALATLKKPV